MAIRVNETQAKAKQRMTCKQQQSKCKEKPGKALKNELKTIGKTMRFHSQPHHFITNTFHKQISKCYNEKNHEQEQMAKLEHIWNNCVQYRYTYIISWSRRIFIHKLHRYNTIPYYAATI